MPAAPDRHTPSREGAPGDGAKSPSKERAGTAKQQSSPKKSKKEKSAKVDFWPPWLADQDDGQLFEVVQSEAAAFLHVRDWSKALQSYTKVTPRRFDAVH